jgi:1,4-dihydroxy-2-naphthoyl-CoA synthase
LDAAGALARRIAEHSPIPVEVGLAYENDPFTYEMRTADAAEGRAAFAERRSPQFRGE